MTHAGRGAVALLALASVALAGASCAAEAPSARRESARDDSYLIARLEDGSESGHERRSATAREVLEALLRLPDVRLDLGLAALVVAKEVDPDISIYAGLGEIATIAAEIQRRLDRPRPASGRAGAWGLDPEAVAGEMARYLFAELGFGVDPADPSGDRPENLFLPGLLARRRGHCLSLSVLYLAVADRLRVATGPESAGTVAHAAAAVPLPLPFYGVRAPGHFFVRYDDGERRFNIETTAGGSLLSDDELLRARPVPTELQTQGIYLRNLDRREVVAEMLLNRGTYYRTLGRSAGQALRDYDLALELAPRHPDLYTNRAAAWLELGDPVRAEADLFKARELGPEDPVVTYNLALAATAQGRLREAVAYYGEALRLDPHRFSAIVNKAALHEALGEPAQAIAAYREALGLDPGNRDVRAALARLGERSDRGE